jgi:hypothetical protein
LYLDAILAAAPSYCHSPVGTVACGQLATEGKALHAENISSNIRPTKKETPKKSAY